MPRLLSFEELRAHGILYGRRWIDQLEADGRFPPRVKIGERRVGWVADEIDEYVQNKIDRRRPIPVAAKKKKAG